MRELYTICPPPEEAIKNIKKHSGCVSGTAKISPDLVVADSINSYKITYTAGKNTLYKDMGISIRVPDKGWSAPSLDCNERGYIDIYTDADAKLEVFIPQGPNTDHWFCVRVLKGEIKKGESIFIYYGGKGENAPGAETPNYPGEFRFMVSFSLDPFPEYAREKWASEHPGYCIYSDRLEAEPMVAVEGNLAKRTHLTLPSTGICSTKAKLVVQLMDYYHNPASQTKDMKVKLEWDTGDKIEDVVFDNQYPFRFELPVKLPSEEGVFYILGQWDDQTWISNPIEVKKQTDVYVYWGDLHAQGAQSDGYGEPEEYFRRARYDACLDIACLTDHSDGLCFPIMLDSNERRENKWDNLNKVTKSTCSPGEFINFPAMELSSDVKRYPSGLHERNHRNAYFYDEDDSVCFNWREFPDATDWYRFLQKTKYMIIPHTHTAKLDCCYHNPMTERVIEIMSDKGSGEFFHIPDLSATENHGGVLEFLKQGYRVGFVGSGDYHHNTPGRHFPLKEKSGFLACVPDMAGLAAIRSSSLKRNEVWDALYNRNTYATTGVRIILDVIMKHNQTQTAMAEEKVIDINDCSPREFVVNYALTGPLKRIELIRNGDIENPVSVYEQKEISSYFNKNNYVGEILLSDHENLSEQWLDASFPPMPKHKFIFYYIRITQIDDEIAWSSPIWLSDSSVMPLLNSNSDID